MEVLTSGKAEGETGAGGRRRATFVADHVEGFTLALAPHFEHLEMERDGVKVEIVVPAESEEAFREVGERALDAATFYRHLYGFFPHDRLGILPGPRQYAGGWPMPNVFMIHRADLSDRFIRFITAHELGHYYWGLHVLSAAERLNWLVLANGIFADQLYLARYYGRSLEEQWRTRGNGDWMEDFLTARVADWEQNLDIDAKAEEALAFDYNSLIRHGKGAVGLYLQARRIGVDRFIALQRELLRDFRYRPLSADTFAARLEAAGAPGAMTFLRDWARGDASIGYTIGATEPADSAPHRWRIVVRRTGTVGYPVDVEVRGEQGGEARLTIDPTAKADTLSVSVDGDPSVSLDPEGAVPLWNSSHPGIQALYIHALYDADLVEPFLALSGPYLTHQSDPAMQRRRISALTKLRRNDELLELAASRMGDGCSALDACRSTLFLVRSLAGLGRIEAAQALLDAVRAAALDLGLTDEVAAADHALAGEGA